MTEACSIVEKVVYTFPFSPHARIQVYVCMYAYEVILWDGCCVHNGYEVCVRFMEPWQHV